MKYKYLGYFNGIDAVINNHLSPEKIIENMKNGEGNFFHTTDELVLSETDLAFKYSVYTADKKYAVTYDVADRFNSVPLDSIYNDDEKKYQDEYIDIYIQIS